MAGGGGHRFRFDGSNEGTRDLKEAKALLDELS
jgi:hypothetical protein